MGTHFLSICELIPKIIKEKAVFSRKTSFFARHLARADWLVACAFPRPSPIVSHARRPVDHHQSIPMLNDISSLRGRLRKTTMGIESMHRRRDLCKLRLSDLEVPEEASITPK